MWVFRTLFWFWGSLSWSLRLTLALFRKDFAALVKTLKVGAARLSQREIDEELKFFWRRARFMREIKITPDLPEGVCHAIVGRFTELAQRRFFEAIRSRFITGSTEITERNLLRCLVEESDRAVASVTAEFPALKKISVYFSWPKLGSAP